MSDLDHAKALRETGFWGRRAAGCIFMARDTGRFLICHRSRNVEQPLTWGTWGGAVDPQETPEAAVLREAAEECGAPTDQIELVPLLVFRHASGFEYRNYLAVVDTEFEPDIAPENQWEVESWKWCEHGDWPEPLHFGLKGLLADPESAATILAAKDRANESKM
jgi:8-oxo-dGTP pyrophosphatase MutT (NUDIX family)